MSIWKRDIAKTTKAKGLLSLKFSSLWMTFWPISGISTRASVCVWAKEQAKSFHKIPPALRICLTAGGLRRCNVCFHHSGESSFVFGFGRKWAKITPPAAQFFSLEEVTDTFSLTPCARTPQCWFSSLPRISWKSDLCSTEIGFFWEENLLVQSHKSSAFEVADGVCKAARGLLAVSAFLTGGGFDENPGPD